MVARLTHEQAVLYARVSSKDQEREGFSIPAQQKLLRQHANERGFVIIREFIDVETATQTGRTGFGDMLAFLRATPSCRTILVEKTDRLYRNIRDWVTIDELDVAVHFVKEGAVVSKTSRSSDKFMHGIQVLMAKQYVDNLSEEVKKGLREKAEQGHWPGVAHVGYINNRTTRRIEVDPGRGPLVARVFALYAMGDYSLQALTRKAFEIGLRHCRGNRRMTKSEIHRMLRNPIYTGDFLWLGKRHGGSHEPLITHETFEQVQAVLGGKPRTRSPRPRHAFMGLLTCGRCGCRMTAEMKKGRYVYYRCTGFLGACGNSYIRQEELVDRLGTVIERIQIPSEIADWIADSLRESQHSLEQTRRESIATLSQRRQAMQSNLDRGYDDYLEGRLSQSLWMRKSADWESELVTIDAELSRLSCPTPAYVATGEKILELAKTAHSRYLEQDLTERRRLLDTGLSNCTFDRGTLCPTHAKPFDLLAQGVETGNWRREWESCFRIFGSFRTSSANR